jgi:hypothetical protein
MIKYVSDVHFGSCLFEKGGNAVGAAAGTKALEHQGKSEAGNHTGGNAGKNNVEIVGIIGKGIRLHTDQLPKIGGE